MESLSPPLVSNRMQSTLNNHTKNMPALSWGASSVSNLQALSSKPSTEEAVGKHPRSRSLSDGNCIWPGGWAKDSCWKSRWIYGKIGSANQGIFIPKYFLGCLWISVEPIRRFRKKNTGPTSSSFARRICSLNLANSVIIPLKWHFGYDIIIPSS